MPVIRPVTAVRQAIDAARAHPILMEQARPALAEWLAALLPATDLDGAAAA